MEGLSPPRRALSIEALREIVDPNVDTRASRAFDLTIQVLIVITLVAFSIETLPDLPPWLSTSLGWIEIVTVGIFTAEYLLRIAVARKKLGFIFSFYGIVDLLAILPFYIALGFDLRSLRIMRLFRLFRVFKMLRYNRAMQHFRDAVNEVREELVLYFIATGMLIYLSSSVIYHFESAVQPENYTSVFHSMWWSVVTLTTVGYGDVYPVTTGGRIFTTFLLLVGLGVIAVPSGLIASGLTKTKKLAEEDKAEKGEAGEALPAEEETTEEIT